ncbi:MAG: putative sulfate/molybdate transporter [Chloroherpetonaceae bacterium]|nr:putative sulfate/molybdate transporter [Chloroherpetonaceae bacterium]
MLEPRTTAVKALRFDRNEWNGAFGDIGTDLPLLAGMTIAAQLDAASTLIVFGLMQVLTGVLLQDAYACPASQSHGNAGDFAKTKC